MPIDIRCGNCGKQFSVADQHLGKKGRCPQCSNVIPIVPRAEGAAITKPVGPARETNVSATPRPTSPVASNSPAVARAATSAPATVTGRSPASSPAPAKQNPPAPKQTAASPVSGSSQASRTPLLGESRTPVWLRHLHWLLLLTLIPLAINILADTNDVEVRVEETMNSLDEDTIARIENEQPEEVSDLFKYLPGHKFQGALLAHDTWMHWVFALGAVLLFLLFFSFLAIDGSANPLHLLGIGAFTATGGVFLLLGFQYLAATASSLGRIRIRGVFALIYFVIILIGWSYAIADNPEFSFWPSFFGFTFGVGLCEEICKAIPLLYHFASPNKQSWRGAFLWGLASGAGFGVAEGVLYSSRYYNGIFGADIYFVRFISCVALHAVWSGSIGITIHRRQELLRDHDEEGGIIHYLGRVIYIIAIPMVLHGLYDVLLKKDMALYALLTAVASFVWLAWQIHLRRDGDQAAENAEFERQYTLARKAYQRS